MHVRLLGDARDVTGFALAGVDGEECRTRGELLRALEGARRDPNLGIIIVSADVAALAEEVIADMRESARFPIAVVLPGEEAAR
jgi:vacuolar-type H+-ATPase subunit F/Vma7